MSFVSWAQELVDLLDAVLDDIVWTDGSWEQAEWMVNVWTRKCRIRISPDLEVLPRKLLGNERVELQRRSKTSANLLEVLDLQDGRR